MILWRNWHFLLIALAWFTPLAAMPAGDTMRVFRAVPYLYPVPDGQKGWIVEAVAGREMADGRGFWLLLAPVEWNPESLEPSGGARVPPTKINVVPAPQLRSQVEDLKNTFQRSNKRILDAYTGLSDPAFVSVVMAIQPLERTRLFHQMKVAEQSKYLALLPVQEAERVTQWIAAHRDFKGVVVMRETSR